MAVIDAMVSKHLQPGEILRGTVPAYTDGGFGRRVLGVTDRRVLLIKSSYLRFADRGLLWADDARGVRVAPGVVKTSVQGVALGQVPSGNAYVTVIRADGSLVPLNIRRGFLFLPQTNHHLANLFELLPHRL